MSPGRAAALGAIQGPTELLPVSSSAHISLVPWLAGWPWQELDAEARKSFEVALHAGTAAALLIGLRREIADELRAFDAPARRGGGALVRAARHRRARAGAADRGARHAARDRGRAWSPASIAMVARRPRAPGARAWRRERRDGLALGLAQAAALVPGVSRNGATLTAARARGFTREQANLLSRTVALPVIVGAAGLKGARLRRRGVAPGTGRALAIGGGGRRSPRRSPRSG